MISLWLSGGFEADVSKYQFKKQIFPHFTIFIKSWKTIACVLVVVESALSSSILIMLKLWVPVSERKNYM